MYSGDRSGKRLVGVWRSISRSGELIEGGAGICGCFFAMVKRVEMGRMFRYLWMKNSRAYMIFVNLLHLCILRLLHTKVRR